MIKKIFLVARLIYALMLVLNLVIFLAALPMYFKEGVSSNANLRVLGDLISLSIAGAALLLSHLAVKAYGSWMCEEKSELQAILKNIKNVLYLTVLLDVVYVIQKYSFTIARRTQEEIALDNPALAHLNEFKPVVMSVLNLVLPRPVGVSAILLALFISLYLKDQSRNQLNP